MRTQIPVWSLTCAAILLLSTASARAENVELTVDPANSFMNLQMTVTGPGGGADTQTVDLSGTIKATILGGLNPSSIEFQNQGPTVSGTAAVFTIGPLVATLSPTGYATSSAQLPVTSGVFDVSGLSIDLEAGTLSFNQPPISRDFATDPLLFSLNPANATITATPLGGNNVQYDLNVPDMTFDNLELFDDGTNAAFISGTSGQLQATGVALIPEPTSLALAALALLSLVGVVWRRRQ